MSRVLCQLSYTALNCLARCSAGYPPHGRSLGLDGLARCGAGYLRRRRSLGCVSLAALARRSHVSPQRLPRSRLSPLTDLNRRPLPYHGSALPTELRGRTAQDSNAGRRATLPEMHPETTGTADEVAIRLVERRDAEGIRAIYNHYVTESTAL